MLKTNDLLPSSDQSSAPGLCNKAAPASAAAGLAPSCSAQAKLLTQLQTMKQQHRKMPSASEISDELQDSYKGEWLAGPQT